MSYLSFVFYIFVIVSIFAYYVTPLKCRWFILLVGSIYFYYRLVNDFRTLLVFFASILSSFAFGLLIENQRRKGMKLSGGGESREIYLVNLIRKITLAGALIFSLSVLVGIRLGEFSSVFKARQGEFAWIFPVGISFYSLQIAAYLIDVYAGRINAQRNFLKYTLFVSFFPQIIQGPIPRYGQLEKQLFDGNKFDAKNIVKGYWLIVWGFFLKLMIADKAAIIVNNVFDNFRLYAGGYIFVAAVLYSIQLYTDFLSCVTLSRGVAQLFGITLVNNFNHPYFSMSIKEFWRKWHISLSSWLRDYVYIPLGGNRKGKSRKYVNLFITFVISGFWHGGSWKFLFWGMLHAVYQIAGNFTFRTREKLYEITGIKEGSLVKRGIKAIGTFFFVMIGWIIFRAERLKDGLFMIWSMVSRFNPWIFFDDSLFRLGLDWKECIVLFFSIVVLAAVSYLQCRFNLRDKILEQSIFVQGAICLVAIWVIWIFGTYGFGFDARDFIYGGF